MKLPVCALLYFYFPFLTHLLSHPFSKRFGFGCKLYPAFMIVQLIIATAFSIALVLRPVTKLCFVFLICIQRDVVSLCSCSPPLLLSCTDLLSIGDVN